MVVSAIREPLRAVAESFMVDRCTVINPGEPIDDGQGGTIEGPEERIENVPIWWRQSGLTPTEQAIIERYAPDTVFLAAVPVGIPITHQSRIEYAGERYNVVDILGPRTNEVRRRVVVKRSIGGPS